MTGPAYVLATVTVVIMPDPRKPNLHQMSNIQPPLVRLFPLPMLITRQQHRDAASGEYHAEFELGGVVVRVLETFDDVLKAISDAAKAGEPIARPIGRARIAGAVQGSLPGAQGSQKDELAALRAKMQQQTGISDAAKGMPEDQRKNTIEEVREDLERQRNAPSNAEKIAADLREGTFVGKRPNDMDRNNAVLQRIQEGAKHQDEPVTWDQFVQTDGENTGAPSIKAGDLRIATYDDSGKVWIEAASIDEDGVDWQRNVGVPSELMPLYPSYEAAFNAVRIAGYSRRLRTDQGA
jgi:hypothetical protein